MEPPLVVGTEVVGRYRLEKVLGRGGMGTTYLATDLQKDTEVALKALSLRRIDDWKAVELFEREAAVLKALDHPLIPNYIDFFRVEEGRPAFCLVQELAPGRSLRERMDAGFRPNEAEVRQIALQVLDILCYLQHREPPVIHRDIKPENLLIDDDGTVRLVDFGSVRELVAGTKTGSSSTVVGTYGYMAPEQFSGKAMPATDLYGLGATICFLITGTQPSKLPQKRLTIDFRRKARCSPGFALWLDRMIAPMAENRFLSATEALGALSGERALVPLQPEASLIRFVSDPSGETRIVIPAPGMVGPQLSLLGGLGLWTLFCMVLLFVLRARFYRPGMILPLLIWLPVLVVGLGVLFKKAWDHQELVCEDGDLYLEFFWRGQRSKRERVAKSEVKLLQQGRAKGRGVCELVTPDKTIQFGHSLSDTEQRWLLAEMGRIWDLPLDQQLTHRLSA